MDHNLHANAQLHHHHHWGYGAAAMPTAPQNHWIPPPQSQHALSAGPAVGGNGGVVGVIAGGGGGGGSVGVGVSQHTRSHTLKRAMSESDCEDLYSEESSKEQISPSESGSCQLMSRKKRRGVIEKKRRDRINSSLTELKRLVPSAYEKQGSAKLEKAEILQLTVEHLKNLQGKGVDSLAYDPQRFAMEYHIIGFRECAAEVARYLVTIEGLEIQDPLRLRLMSHLQYFAQQREMSAKSCASPGGAWSTGPAAAAAVAAGAYQASCGVPPPYQTYPSSASVHSAHSSIATSGYVTPLHPSYPAVSLSPTSSGGGVHQQQQQQQQQHQHAQQQQQQHSQQHSQQHVSQATSTNCRSSSASVSSTSNEALPLMSQPQSQQATPVPQSQQQQQQQQQQGHYTQEHNAQQHADHQSAGSTYIELSNAQAHSTHRDPSSTTNLTANAYDASTAQYPGAGGAPDYNSTYATPNGSKPYRPWGAEMAY